MDKLLFLMFAGCDGRAANVEHQRQQRRHIYVVYVTPHGQYAWFAMLAITEILAAEVRQLLISSHDSGGPGDGTLAS